MVAFAPATLTAQLIPPALNVRPITAAHIAYLDSALALLKAHSLRADSVDWKAVRRTVLERLDALPDRMRGRPDQLAVLYALEIAGGEHASYIPLDLYHQFQSRKAEENPVPEIRREGKLGYLQVPHYLGLDKAEISRYAAEAQARLHGVDDGGVCGWIVDLRGNGGGNMYPMLAMVGPMLGADTAGYMIGPGHVSPWGYRGGTAWSGKEIWATIPTARPMAAGHLPVAVLFDGKTASSGEAMVLAFRGRPDTRSFGEPTRGLSTSNDLFVLPDSAFLNITTSRMADRNRGGTGGPIAPDVPLAPDSAPTAARSWLLGRAACRGG